MPGMLLQDAHLPSSARRLRRFGIRELSTGLRKQQGSGKGVRKILPRFTPRQFGGVDMR
ncbi:hypothetical protein D3C81_1750840 [compost metagenome]